MVNPYAAPEADANEGWQPAESGYRLAGLERRWLGALADQFFFGVSCVPAGVAYYASQQQLLAPSLVAAATTLPFAVLQFYWIATVGQSLGKKLCKTRIVRLDGSAPGFLHGVVLRAWVFWAAAAIPGIGSAVGLADALLIFRADRRCVHDHIAGTRVISA